MSTEYKEGYRAYFAGVRLNENPYEEVKEINKYNDWSFGWIDAEIYEDFLFLTAF